MSAAIVKRSSLPWNGPNDRHAGFMHDQQKYEDTCVYRKSAGAASPSVFQDADSEPQFSTRFCHSDGSAFVQHSASAKKEPLVGRAELCTMDETRAPDFQRLSARYAALEVVLTCRGSPQHVSFLDGSWSRDLGSPTRNGKPHFRRQAGDLQFHLYHTGTHWLIAAGCLSLKTIAFAASDAEVTATHRYTGDFAS
eukprot:771591-Pleurochrysis_carterae.AAC.1